LREAAAGEHGVLERDKSKGKCKGFERKGREGKARSFAKLFGVINRIANWAE